MAETITISVPDGADEELIGAIYEAVASVLLGTKARRDSRPIDEDEDLAESRRRSEVYSGDQLEPNLRWFLSEVTPNARLLIRTIAEEASSVGEARSSRLRERLGAKSSATLGGWAASIGFAMKRLRLAKPYIRTYEYGPDGWEAVYRMEPAIAEATLRLVDEDGRVRPEH